MKKLLVVIIPFIVWLSATAAGNGDPLQRVVHINKQKTTLYEALNHIGDLSGYNFIYDSKLVDNDRKIKLSEGDYPLRDLIFTVLGNTNFALKTVDHYIVIDRKTESAHPSVVKAPAPRDSMQYITVSGTICDKVDKTPISDCTISIQGTSTGTVANSAGQFALKIPVAYGNDQVLISHLGYESRVIPVPVMAESSRVIYLNQRIIPMQEVIVRMVNPRKIIEEILQFRDRNYPSVSSYSTTFYREGIEKRQQLVSLSEAVFKVYKSPYTYNSTADDQMKILKMRKITNQSIKDTFLLKMKAGPDAMLVLDIVKSVPDFLEINDDNQYNYSKTDMTVIDSHLAHVVSFEQKESNPDPLYKGKLYVDAVNSALLHAELEVNPKYIGKAESLFIAKRGKNVQIKPQQVLYSVSYKQIDGKYYINHLRGDLFFKMKMKNQLFYSPIHIFMEMVSCSVDTLDAKPFPRQERLQTRKVFSDTEFRYDPGFWGNFNIILPNENMTEAISRLAAKIEESEEQ
jgi:hypothetical protein